MKIAGNYISSDNSKNLKSIFFEYKKLTKVKLFKYIYYKYNTGKLNNNYNEIQLI